MVEIAVWALKWPPQPGFQSLVGSKSKLAIGGPFPLFTPRMRDFGLIPAFHSISTLSMSHFKYDEWSFKVHDIWVQHVWLSHHTSAFESWIVDCGNKGGSWCPPMFHTKMVYGVCLFWFLCSAAFHNKWCFFYLHGTSNTKNSYLKTVVNEWISMDYNVGIAS